MKIKFKDILSALKQKYPQIKKYKWNTPNTYDEIYRKLSTTAGVYLIISYDLENLDISILYIGSSKNLLRRYKSHNIIRLLSELPCFIMTYFTETNGYLKIEKDLISEINPPYNKVYRTN